MKNKLIFTAGGSFTSNGQTSKQLRTNFETYLWGTKNILLLRFKFRLVSLKAIKSSYQNIVTKIFVPRFSALFVQNFSKTKNSKFVRLKL